MFVTLDLKFIHFRFCLDELPELFGDVPAVFSPVLHGYSAAFIKELLLVVRKGGARHGTSGDQDNDGAQGSSERVVFLHDESPYAIVATHPICQAPSGREPFICLNGDVTFEE